LSYDGPRCARHYSKRSKSPTVVGMGDSDLASHWNTAYRDKGEDGVSWFQDAPDVSLELIASIGGPKNSLIDIGGGASRLVDALLAAGVPTVTVLDISQASIDLARARVGDVASQVEWIVSDVTHWQPSRTYDVWHDRAAFHFLTDAADRQAYVANLERAVTPGGHAIVATFAPDGPERCSGLPIKRYDPQSLAETVGPGFVLVDSRRHVHTTPWGSTQAFQFSVLRKA
jgi:ubiquinone/menaquinone biosynthesis C-methylase UbiE